MEENFNPKNVETKYLMISMIIYKNNYIFILYFRLVHDMYKDPRINVHKDWKMTTILIGMFLQ